MRFFPSGRRIVVVSGAELVKQVFTRPTGGGALGGRQLADRAR